MNLMRFLDWRFRSTTWFALAVVLLCVLGTFLLPDSWGNKNSPLETLQMVVLFSGLILTSTAQKYRSLFVCLSLVLFAVIAREVNFGRTLFFFANPEDANQFPKWKDMEYGWLAHVLVGCYMGGVLVYSVCRKVWRDIFSLLSKERLPVWDVLLAAAGLITSLAFEMTHERLSEELSELVLYVCGVGILYLYTRNKLKPVD